MPKYTLIDQARQRERPLKPSAATERFREVMGRERAKKLTGRQMLDRYFDVQPAEPKPAPKARRAGTPLWVFGNGIEVRANTLGEARAFLKVMLRATLPKGLRATRKLEAVTHGSGS